MSSIRAASSSTSPGRGAPLARHRGPQGATLSKSASHGERVHVMTRSRNVAVTSLHTCHRPAEACGRRRSHDLDCLPHTSQVQRRGTKFCGLSFAVHTNSKFVGCSTRGSQAAQAWCGHRVLGAGKVRSRAAGAPPAVERATAISCASGAGARAGGAEQCGAQQLPSPLGGRGGRPRHVGPLSWPSFRPSVRAPARATSVP